MKKLRLIKPWRLRAVRRSLEHDKCIGTGAGTLVTCSPPVSREQENLKRRNPFINNQVRLAIGECPEDRREAPFSDVIFVCSNKNIR